MAPQVHDDRYLAEAVREMVASFQARRFQHVVALFDQLLQRQVGMTPAELLDQLAAAGGKNVTSVVTRSYAYDSCWFCDTGMARCETCDGRGQIDEGLYCVDCHALGKARCTVCRGSSFVILEEMPEFFRDRIVQERLNLAERAFAELSAKYETLKPAPGEQAGLVRRLQHQNQQVIGVLHNCHARISKSRSEEMVSKFNAMVRAAQDRYHELTLLCAQCSVESARRLVQGEHGQADRPQQTKLARSIEHHISIARGYIDILNRAGIRKPGETLELEIQGIERRLRPDEVQRMVVPVGEAAPEPLPSPKPKPKKAEPESQPVTEFTEDLTDAQIEKVWTMMREEYWMRDRTLEQVREAIHASNVNIAMIRREGKSKKVIGYVRALSDGVLKAGVYDFVISKEFRGAGLGRLLMSRLMSHPLMTHVRDVEIASLPEAVRMFKQWGYSGNVDGLVLLRYTRRK